MPSRRKRRCGRSGQYRKQTLIERYGADIRLPDLREEITQKCKASWDKCTTPAWCIMSIWSLGVRGSVR